MRERSFGEHLEHLAFLVKKWDKRYFGGRTVAILSIAAFIPLPFGLMDAINLETEINTQLDSKYDSKPAIISPYESIYQNWLRLRNSTILHDQQRDRINKNNFLMITGLVSTAALGYSLVNKATSGMESWIEAYKRAGRRASIPLEIQQFVDEELFFIDLLPEGEITRRQRREIYE